MNEPLRSTFDETYDAIFCNLPQKFDNMFASKSQTTVPVCAIESFNRTFAKENEVFNLLRIDVDLFL